MWCGAENGRKWGFRGEWTVQAERSLPAGGATKWHSFEQVLKTRVSEIMNS